MKVKTIIHSIKNKTFFDDAKVSIFIRFLFPLYSFLCKKMKVQEDKIVFLNFYGRGYGDNPKYIAEYIIENKLPYRLVWLIDNKKCKEGNALPTCIKPVPYRSFKSVKELATAGVWVDNCRKEFFPKKKDDQMYIQTWHGTFLTKKIEADADLSEGYIRNAKKDSKAIDFLLSSNTERTKQMKRCFWYDGEIAETGCPRDDILFDENKIVKSKNKICDFYNIPKNNKILLYLPTFRNSHTLEPYKIDYSGIIDSLGKRFSGKWTAITRLHPGMVSFADKLNLPHFVMNGTFWNDTQELLSAADVILTDYSSMGDYSLYLKPLFMYCPDLEDYKKERGFEIPIESYPFPISKTNEELKEKILNFNKEDYDQKVEEYYKSQGLKEDGTACEKVLKLIEEFQTKRCGGAK